MVTMMPATTRTAARAISRTSGRRMPASRRFGCRYGYGAGGSTRNRPGGAPGRFECRGRPHLVPLHGREEVGHLDAQGQADSIERFDRGGVLSEFDLRQVAERDAGLFGHRRE